MIHNISTSHFVGAKCFLKVIIVFRYQLIKELKIKINLYKTCNISGADLYHDKAQTYNMPFSICWIRFLISNINISMNIKDLWCVLYIVTYTEFLFTCF